MVYSKKGDLAIIWNEIFLEIFSQILVMPPFQRMGLGSIMLENIYEQYKMEMVLEMTMEERVRKKITYKIVTLSFLELGRWKTWIRGLTFIRLSWRWLPRNFSSAHANVWLGPPTQKNIKTAIIFSNSGGRPIPWLPKSTRFYRCAQLYEIARVFARFYEKRYVFYDFDTLSFI